MEIPSLDLRYVSRAYCYWCKALLKYCLLYPPRSPARLLQRNASASKYSIRALSVHAPRALHNHICVCKTHLDPPVAAQPSNTATRATSTSPPRAAARHDANRRREVRLELALSRTVCRVPARRTCTMCCGARSRHRCAHTITLPLDPSRTHPAPTSERPPRPAPTTVWGHPHLSSRHPRRQYSRHSAADAARDPSLVRALATSHARGRLAPFACTHPPFALPLPSLCPPRRST